MNNAPVARKTDLASTSGGCLAENHVFFNPPQSPEAFFAIIHPSENEASFCGRQRRAEEELF